MTAQGDRWRWRDARSGYQREYVVVEVDGGVVRMMDETETPNFMAACEMVGPEWEVIPPAQG